MSRDWRLYLDDILGSCEKVQRFTTSHASPGSIPEDPAVDASFTFRATWSPDEFTTALKKHRRQFL